MNRKIYSLLTRSFFLLSFIFVSQRLVFAQGVKTWENCVDEAGIPTLSCFDVVLGNLLVMSSGLIVVVLFVMFIIGGLSYLTSGGDHEKVAKAQGTLKYAVLGIILFVCAFLIIKVIDVLFLGGNDQLFQFNIDTPPPTP